MGRQSMDQLVVDYDGGAIKGQGTDVVVKFILRGRIEEGAIHIDKWYIGKHTVIYTGVSEGEGGYAGSWAIGGVEGGKWAIRFRSFAEGSREIQAIRPEEDQ